MKQLGLLISLLSFPCLELHAQQVASPEDTTVVISSADANDTGAEESADPAAPYIIFSNLGATDDRYNSNSFDAKPVIGKLAHQDNPEQWDAVRFVPKVDVQASVLEAAIGYSSGTRVVKLSIYSNDPTFNVPGAPLPGAQVSTTEVPDLGTCCQLVKVTLPQPVTLTAGTIYWLVGSPDNNRGPDFNGAWEVSHLGESAGLDVSSPPWRLIFGEWLAARVSGNRLEPLGPVSEANRAATSALGSRRVTIFSNLTRAFPTPYIPGVGLTIEGNEIVGAPEIWEAIPFTPKANVRAKTLKAAIVHTSFGAKAIKLGIFSDSGGLPGAPFPGGQGGTTDIPEKGDCCEFASVKIPGADLSAGVQYWLVASPDDSIAPEFVGEWQISTNTIWAKIQPGHTGWTGLNGDWAAALISGQAE